MDIDLEDQLRSEIDDLHYEIEQLRAEVNLLRQIFYTEGIGQHGSGNLYDQWTTGIPGVPEVDAAQRKKNARLQDFLDATKYGMAVGKIDNVKLVKYIAEDTNDDND